MKKLLILSILFCFSFGLQAQTISEEDFDKMREQMRENMGDMMKMFEESFDIMEAPMMKMDTFFFKNFGSIDENGAVAPNEDIKSLFQEIEQMMRKEFGDMEFEMSPFEGKPAIPGPEDLEEEKEAKPKKEGDSEKKKKDRKTYRL